MSTADWWSQLSPFSPELLGLSQQVILVLCAIVSGLLGVYAMHVWILTFLAFRRRAPPTISPPSAWPSVSVHVPVYNEKSVISRLLDSILAFDYPRDKFEIIVVDDSSDGTTELARSYERNHPGLVTVIHRKNRDGFKAGALRTALARSKGEFFAVFDADHIPPKDFLRRMIPYLSSDDTVAFAQARPTYLRDGDSWVTRALTLGTDSYAFVDQEARFSANLLTHFSGGGAVFRRKAVTSVGGWSSDTLAEDLDLSIRLRLKGWHYVYDESVTCPGEVPASFSILRQQQFRWASGFAGCLKKHMRSLVTTEQMSLLQKAEAVVYLTDYVASPLIAVGVVLAILYCLVFPLNFIINGYRSDMLVTFTVLMSALIYTAPLALFAVAAFRSTAGWLRRAGRLVDLVYLGVVSVAIFLTSARAVLNGFLNRAAYFYRTPKDGDAATSRTGD